MNRKPVQYFQTDSRWKNVKYAVKDETSTIESAGCGPTCCAMVIASLQDKSVTPKETALWLLNHGGKAYKQGTYYSGIVNVLKAFKIGVRRLNGASVYHNPNSSYHVEALKHVNGGGWVIACMGKGTWTSSGHFVLWYDYDGKCKIHDPASTKTARINGDYATFKKEVKYYFLIDVPKGVEDLTEKEVRAVVVDVLKTQIKSVVADALNEIEAERAKLPASYKEGQAALDRMKKEGIIKGDDKGNVKARSYVERQELAIIIGRTLDSLISEI